MEKCCLLSTQPEVLSVENIAKLRNRLESLEGLSHALERCLDHSLLKFSREEGCLQENAQLVIRCEEKQLVFVSGNGESSIEVSFVQANPCYKILLPKFGDMVEKSPCGRLLLSVENLEKITGEIISWREMTKGLKACLEYGRDHFSKEPIRVQKNCRMLIQQDGKEFELISGDGENCIRIYRTADRKIQYDIELSTVLDRFVRAFTPSVW